MELQQIVNDVADVLVAIDKSGVSFKTFQCGVGPYSEPQLLTEVAKRLNELSAYSGIVKTRRTPDLLIADQWALEFKIARPFGDNGKQAENWSVNLLHPYPGNVSSIGDCIKLKGWSGKERTAVVVVGYEHVPAQIDLTPLIEAFEAVARNVMCIQLGSRIQVARCPLVHPVHQCVRIFAWEVLDSRHGQAE
jgi:hypothetical protein